MDTHVIITSLMVGLIVFNLAVFAVVHSVKPFWRRSKRQLWGFLAVLFLLLEVLVPIWAMGQGFGYSVMQMVGILGLVFSGILMATGVVMILNRTFFEVIFNNLYVMKVVKVDDFGVWGEICVKKFHYVVRLKEPVTQTRKRAVNEIVNVRVVNMLNDNQFEVVPV